MIYLYILIAASFIMGVAVTMIFMGGTR